MFICNDCGKPTGPKVKPITIVTMTRPMEYTNTVIRKDEFDVETKEIVNSRGSEIVKQVLVCPDCGIPIDERVPAKEPVMRVGTTSFEEKLAPPLKISIASVAFHNAMDRYEHKTKRSELDSNVAIPCVKQFLDLNPKFML